MCQIDGAGTQEEIEEIVPELALTVGHRQVACSCQDLCESFSSFALFLLLRVAPKPMAGVRAILLRVRIQVLVIGEEGGSDDSFAGTVLVRPESCRQNGEEMYQTCTVISLLLVIFKTLYT